MRVFVSYSFNDSELHLLTLLLEKLRNAGHYVESSVSVYHDYLNNNSEHKIQSSDLFLGIITNDSDSIREVEQEWHIAQQNNVESILLVEEGVSVDDQTIKHISFNRHNPKPSINKLFGAAQGSKKKSDDPSSVLIGAGIVIAGVAALIALLSGGDKK
ncbi:MAG: OCTOPUS family protein [Roseivirga sp.]|nr:OCTOPUS family protein [Roseivirga sp.]